MLSGNGRSVERERWQRGVDWRQCLISFLIGLLVWLVTEGIQVLCRMMGY
jgi:hypothetical protein